MDSLNIAKWFIFFGLSLVCAGVFIWIGSKIGIFFGSLPGDIYLKKEKFSFYLPIISSLIISVLLTIIINLILWTAKK